MPQNEVNPSGTSVLAGQRRCAPPRHFIPLRQPSGSLAQVHVSPTAAYQLMAAGGAEGSATALALVAPHPSAAVLAHRLTVMRSNRPHRSTVRTSAGASLSSSEDPHQCTRLLPSTDLRPTSGPISIRSERLRAAARASARDCRSKARTWRQDPLMSMTQPPAVPRIGTANAYNSRASIQSIQAHLLKFLSYRRSSRQRRSSKC